MSDLKDPVMEEISDRIRRGKPVHFLDAIAACNYQGQLCREQKAKRAETFYGKFLNWINWKL